jgi:2-keto-4-pentenoate hydratase/2-oxohepta-3-ene-1,7-dioic acid hydratase in catechol pathway
MDYELELGVVLGRAAADLTPDTAEKAILGVTILNDFSARDIQRREMAAGLGPSKGKHFGSAAGPWIATLDELGPRPDLSMRAEVNGELRCEARSSEMIWSLQEIVAWASTAEVLPAGSLLGTGTANGGSGVEFGQFLNEGDVVSLSIDKLGTLSNTLGARESGWTPVARQSADPGS